MTVQSNNIPEQAAVEQNISEPEVDNANEGQLLDRIFTEEAVGNDEGAGEGGSKQDSLEQMNPQDDLAELADQMKQEQTLPFEGKVNEYSLKLPKGIAPDNELLQEFTTLAKTKKVDQEMVQKSVEMLDRYQAKFFENVVKKDQEFRQNINNQFIRMNKADPVYGGPNYEASVNYAMKALRRFVPKEDLLATQAKDGRMGMLEYLKLSNSMNATPLWKFFVEVGKMVSESAPMIPGAAKTQKPMTAEDAIFGMIK